MAEQKKTHAGVWLNPPPAPSAIPDVAAQAVLAVPEECKMPEGTPTVRGYDFNKGVNMDELLASFSTMGFQGSNLGFAIEEINEMVRVFKSVFGRSSSHPADCMASERRAHQRE